MLQNWKNRPTIIEKIPENKIILFIDESGNGSKKIMKNCYHEKENHNQIDLRNDIFLLNGILMEGKEHANLSKRFSNLKKELTEDGYFEYEKYGKRQINFRNTEIERHLKPFNHLSLAFIKKINRNISKTNFHQIAVGLNYFSYFEKNVMNDQSNPLLMTLGIMITNYANYLNENNKEGIIIFESETRKHDELKLKYILKLKKHGTRKHDKNIYNSIVGVYFRNKWLEDKNGNFKTCAGLELADLTISPLRRLYHPEFISIERKLLNYPNYGKNAINIIR